MINERPHKKLITGQKAVELSEIDTQIEISLRLGYMSRQVYEEIEARLTEVEKLLSGLSRSII
jgi:four helix bundle protein